MGRRAYCDDWACPARASCARHFGRAEAYWSMRQEGDRFFKGGREPEGDSWPVYERDRIQPWMIEAFAVRPVSASWRMPLYVDVGGW